MKSLKTCLKEKKIIISPQYFGVHDYETYGDIKTIIENPEIFKDFHITFPLIKISNLDDYYQYLLIDKFINFEEIIQNLLQEEHKKIIENLVNHAKKLKASIKNKDVIQFINNNINKILEEDESIPDILSVTLDNITNFNSGISEDTFIFLSKKCKYLLIDKFDNFEKIFEKYPDLFESVYYVKHLREIVKYRLKKTFGIWQHILRKKKSNLKKNVEENINIIAEYVRELNDTMTIDNVMQNKEIIKTFFLFLKETKSHMTNEFENYFLNSQELLSKYIHEKGYSFQYEIPIENLNKEWETPKEWYVQLLCLTHAFVTDNETISCNSLLSKESKIEYPSINFVYSNINENSFFTITHQQWLKITAFLCTERIYQILNNPKMLTEYLNLIVLATSCIVEYLQIEKELLKQDISMLIASIKTIVSNIELNNDSMRGMCYGTSMYTCTLAEKFLRIFYIHLAKDEKYIPANKATLGELLGIKNQHIINVFGESHIKNLSFFFQQTPSSNIGENIRNSLAHWTNMQTSTMTPFFVAKILWLFTDVINTIFWHCIKNKINKNA